MNSNHFKNEKIKSILVYFFLLYLAYVIADICVLKFIKPKFLVKMSEKNKKGLRASTFEPETKSFKVTELGDRRIFTDKIIERNIFNSKEMPKPIASFKGRNRPEDFEDGEPVLSALQLTLEGTVVHRNPFRSLATITNSKNTMSYTVGDKVADFAEIISVIRKKVIIRNLKTKGLEYIKISKDQVPVKAPVVRNKFRSSNEKSSNLIKKDGNRFTAKRADVDAQIANISSLARQAKSRLVRDPATGEVLGYQIFDIKPGLLQGLGIQNEDIIIEVNGRPITNPLQATSAFSKLKDKNEIRTTINRGGRIIQLDYIIE